MREIQNVTADESPHRILPYLRDDICIALVCAVVVLIRLSTALYFGPIKTPDSAAYIAQAKCIIEVISANAPPCPEAAYRSPGYGFVLASLMRIFGSAWDWVLISLQISLSFLASFFVARLMLALSGSLPLSIIAFAMHNLGVPLSVDLWLLRDSLFASLITIALTYCARLALRPKPIGAAEVLVVGLLFGLGAALRDESVFYGVFFAPLIVWWLLRCLKNKRALAVSLVIVLAPTVVLQVALKSWNQSMTGSYVVSTISKTVLTAATLELAKKHSGLYDGETPLDFAARETLKKYDLAEVYLMEQLLRNQGVTDDKIIQMVNAKYLEAWVRYPADFSEIVLARFVTDPSRLVFNPAYSILMNKGYTQDDDYFDFMQGKVLKQALRHRRYWDLFLLGMEFGGRIISLLLYCLAWVSFLTSSIAWSSNRGNQQRDPLIVVVFICFLGVTMAYAMTQINIRYVAGVMWIPLLLGLEFPYRLLTQRWHNRTIKDQR